MKFAKLIKLEQEALSSFKRSSDYVIKHRMIPNLLDNKTDVQRRCIFIAKREGLLHNVKRRKLATLVGNTMSVHPHGDAGIAGAMYTLGQPWKQNLIYMDIEGNIGTPFGDSYASPRYTEARLSKYGEFMFTQDMNSDVVPFIPNYDDTLQEPSVLPAVLPDILINGNFGIAVGFTTSFLPHNINDVIDTCKAYVQNRKIKNEDLIKILKAPDFPLGGTIVGNDHTNAYIDGKSLCVQRGTWRKIIEDKTCYIEITTIPYNTTTEDFINGVRKLAQKADDGKIIFNIVGYEDHSNMEGIRIRLKLDDEANYDATISLLLSDTCLEVKHHMNHNVLYNDQFTINISLYEIISNFVKFRETCLYNKFKSELIDVNKRLHILDAILKLAKDKISNIEKLIKEIRTSKNKEDAIKKVIAMYKFSRVQAEYIVNLRLYKLSTLELNEYEDEYKSLIKRKRELENFTSSKQNKYLDKYMIDQWEEYRTMFGYKRKTNIIAKDNLNKVASLIPCTVWLTGYNMIVGAKYRGDIKIESHTQNHIYLVTQRGYLYTIKVPKIMKNPNIDIRKIINLRGDDPIIGIFSSKNNYDIDIVIQGESKFKRYRIQNGFNTGLNGKRIFTGDIVTGVLEKYSGNILIANNSISKTFKLMDFEFDKDYTYYKVMNKKGIFIIK